MARIKKFWIDYEALKRAEERERLTIWNARGVAKIIHPDHGEIVVPCASKLAAIHCAAEAWRCDWASILNASVLWVPAGTKPVDMPDAFGTGLK